MTAVHLASVALLLMRISSSFGFTTQLHSKLGLSISSSSSSSRQLYAVKKQIRTSLLEPYSDTKKDVSKEPVEDVYGAKFFGGSSIKTELIDEQIEVQADQVASLYPKATEEKRVYTRFMDPKAFKDDYARILAQRMQAAVNFALYEEEVESNKKPLYSSSVQWTTPFQKSGDNPIEALTNALSFYKRVDVAIISASSTTTDQVQIRWEISLIWPNLFESRVLLTGTSDLKLDEKEFIISQTDKVDAGGEDGQNIIKAIKPQLDARFWDLYHIGMSPSAELMPRCEVSVGTGVFSNYKLFEIPPRLVLQPTLVDAGGREAREAEIIPNHAFSSIIKTTGPKTQRYVPTNPVEVAIRRNADSKTILTWSIALPPEFISFNNELVAGDIEDELSENATCSYYFQPRRRVATLPFGGMPQDAEVSDVRKKLYDQVVKDGLRPKLENGRPQFFFLQNDAKACFTVEGGLGMSVYDWRPRFAKANEVGIELEL